MVILVDRNFGKELALNEEVILIDYGMIEDTILEYVLKEEVVVALYPSAYRRLLHLINRIKVNGGNPYLYEPVSTKHASLLGQKILPYYLKIKEKMLYKSKPWRTPYRITLAKKVSRRALLRTPINAIREYVSAPIISDPVKCESINKCSKCLSACPHNALSGKPPEVQIEACTGCGLCVAYCPFDLIDMPGWNTQKLIEIVKDVKRACNELTVLIATRDQARNIDEILDVIKTPVVVELVDNVNWVNERIIITLLMNGVDKILINYDPSKTNSMPTFTSLVRQGLPIIIIKSNIELEKLKKLVEEMPRRVKLGGISVNTSTPVRGMVEIGGNCTLCGACESICPTNALLQRSVEDEVYLTFYHDRCVGCGLCKRVCPHDAIIVSYVFNSEMFGKELILARDKIAKCRRCGEPLGPYSKMLRLEEMLKARGYGSNVIESLWLCEKCKEEEYSRIYSGLIRG